LSSFFAAIGIDTRSVWMWRYRVTGSPSLNCVAASVPLDVPTGALVVAICL
jgi:hypothetical protein